MKRPWGYATHLIDCYHAPFWRHMDAFIESGVAVPSCMECGRPVKVRDNCEPVCLDCTWGSAPERATEEVRALRHWPEGRPVVPCWRLFKEPRVLQGSVELLPDHMCEFLWRASTLRWANEHFCPPGGALPQNNGDAWTPTDLDFDYWQLRWPLPIGAGSIARQADSFARGEVPMEMLPPVLRDENGDFPPEILTPAVSVHGGRIVLEDGCPAPYRLPLIAARAMPQPGQLLHHAHRLAAMNVRCGRSESKSTGAGPMYSVQPHSNPKTRWISRGDRCGPVGWRVTKSTFVEGSR